MSKNPYLKAAASIEGRQANLEQMLSSGRIHVMAPRRKAPGKPVPRPGLLADQVLTRCGPLPFSHERLRSHTVSVRLNSHEMSELDAQRMATGNHFKRGEWLRMCWLRTRPKPPIPDINWRVSEHTARSAPNLTQIARIINDVEITHQIELASGALQRWRRSLVRGVNEDSMGEIITPDPEKAKRHGPDVLAEDEVRNQVVSIRLTKYELGRLIYECGGNCKGEWIRMVWQKVKTHGNLNAISESAYKNIVLSANQVNEIARQLNYAVHSTMPDSVINAKITSLRAVLKDMLVIFRNDVTAAEDSMK